MYLQHQNETHFRDDGIHGKQNLQEIHEVFPTVTPIFSPHFMKSLIL